MFFGGNVSKSNSSELRFSLFIIEEEKSPPPPIKKANACEEF